MPFWRPLRRGRGRRWLVWARLAALIAAAVLVRGELLRVRGLYHMPDHPSRLIGGYVDRMRPLLERVPADAWLFTNFQLPMIDAIRPQPGPTAALDAHESDAVLMSGHVLDILRNDLPAHAGREEWRRWIDPLPGPWREGVTILITPDGRWALDPAGMDTVFARPAYLLVVRPPNLPISGERFDTVVRPLLETRLRLEAIQSAADVTLYRVVGLAVGGTVGGSAN
jgi:hypothetical protein